MAAGGHFGWTKITFDRISRHFRSILNFLFSSQNGCRRPFCMTENHFWSHFSPFQINTQFFFSQNVCRGHFRWPKIAFEWISRYFRSIRNFFFLFFFQMAAGGHFGSPIWAILDDRKSLSIAFLAISDQYTICFCFTFFFSKWPPAAILEVCSAPKTIGFFHYVLSMAMPNMKLISGFMTQLETPQAFWAFFIQNVRHRPFDFSDWCQKS